MTHAEEWEQLQAELRGWRDLAHEKHQEVQLLQQEKQVLHEALAEAIQVIERLQEHTKELEGQIEVLHERVKRWRDSRPKIATTATCRPLPIDLCVIPRA